jgi:glycerophosphoryl diester phosphodiesterase
VSPFRVTEDDTDDASPSPIKVIAHRGASGSAPENTLAAIELGIEQGADYIEVDVQRTLDGELVILHDAWLTRTTDAERVFPDRSPWRVGDFRLRELERLDAGSWFGEEFAGQRIPTLQEVLETLEGRAGLFLELKDPGRYPGIEQQVADRLSSHGDWLRGALADERLVITSFDRDSLVRYHATQSETPIAVLFGRRPSEDELQQVRSYASQLNVHVRAVDRAAVDHVRELGMRVNVYGMETEDDLRRAVADGVDCITTDLPERFRALASAAQVTRAGSDASRDASRERSGSRSDGASHQQVENHSFEESTTVVSAGAPTRIYDPSRGQSEQWYYNDHTFVRDAEGNWHLFGITRAEPGRPFEETRFGHAQADRLTQSSWERQPHALSADPDAGEQWIWAPFVVFHRNLYYLFYAAGPGPLFKMQLATSQDLRSWTRHPGNPLFRDGYNARDPMVARVHGRWVMYYTANTDPQGGGNYVVAYRTSDDLVNWSDRRIAFTHPRTGVTAGPTESPFVVRRGRHWYLFMCCDHYRRDRVGSPIGDPYTTTRVYRSDDPFDFRIDDLVGMIDAHAAEIVQDENADWHVSSAGWRQDGVWLGPLEWENKRPIRGRVVTTPFYRMVVQTEPETVITRLEVDPRGRYDYRRVLDNAYRAVGPYLVVDGSGATQAAGPAGTREISADGRRMSLRGIPVGDGQVTVDWTFVCGTETFDLSFRWHVAEKPAAAVREAAWDWESNLPRHGDSGDPDRQASADVGGFGGWVMAYDDDLTVAAAYQAGSAWSEDNRFILPGHMVSWQCLWRPDGEVLPKGDYEGGTWRIGASAQPRDVELGKRLHAQLNDEGPDKSH